MTDARREQLTIVNAFVHDVATGTWLSSLLVMSLFARETRGARWAGLEHLVEPLAGRFMWLTWASLAVIVATGVVRMLTWKVFGWTGDVARDRVRLLKIKHAVLGVAFLAGTVYQALLAYS